ncbi:glycosyltransferase involved in cell wall biosynthesis [Neorhizobium sp. 2083]|uniref:glycosyltransferase family A protein n=1 Tax=Neorhizobium sp. 2083 TaxID=2817762 RepID=UPI002860C0F3|nr:glycosyltransferase family A protein [Neorhizobium sp. 2083]MDR6818103.1 glycosyltransferase involved in cell wall biosynthesis [Neorhizobium sp. 2083]
MHKPSITAVLNAHREGLLALPSLESLDRSVKNAVEAGYHVETIAILDCSDALTQAIIRNSCHENYRIIETDFGDLGLARNCAIEAATGDFVGFLDADDLWGADWLTKAAAIAQTRDDPVIWHPEVNVYFGVAQLLFFHIDMEDPSFLHSGLVLDNYWTALSFGARELYLENPYPATDLRAGIGFEDWTWNMSTISAGVIHKVVPQTGHAIRRKETSLSRDTLKADAISHPGDYIKRLVDERRSY